VWKIRIKVYTLACALWKSAKALVYKRIERCVRIYSDFTLIFTRSTGPSRFSAQPRLPSGGRSSPETITCCTSSYKRFQPPPSTANLFQDVNRWTIGVGKGSEVSPSSTSPPSSGNHSNQRTSFDWWVVVAHSFVTYINIAIQSCKMSIFSRI
jgi:hypothetical protein